MRPVLSGLFFLVLIFLDGHIAEFVGVEDLTAVETLDKFGIFFACDDADLRVLTDRVHGVIGAWEVGIGQIVPGPGRLSTASFHRRGGGAITLNPCRIWNEFHWKRCGAWRSWGTWN